MQDLLQLMYQDGHLSSTELAALRRTSRQLRENSVRVLRSLNVASSVEIKQLLQRYYGFPAATDKLIDEIDESLRPLISADVALHYCVLPIAEEKGELHVLMEDPTDKGVIHQLEFLLQKKIVAVIATVQQLSSGLCRLYGVEPARLRLSGLLETSRGAIGVSFSLNFNHPQLVDDSQPLLDDEVFKRLKVEPSKKPRKRPGVARQQGFTSSSALNQPQEQANTTPAMPSKNRSLEGIATEAELVSVINILGLRLALAHNVNEAVLMANEQLAEFSLQLQILHSGHLLVDWKGSTQEIDLHSPQSIAALPAIMRGLVRKIAQCQQK